MSSKSSKGMGHKGRRKCANKAHRTYQSPTETEDKGWMKQWIVNTVLGRYGGR